MGREMLADFKREEEPTSMNLTTASNVSLSVLDWNGLAAVRNCFESKDICDGVHFRIKRKGDEHRRNPNP